MSRLPLGTYLLSLAQAVNLTAAVLSVSISAVVGSDLARSAALGTVPYGLQFAAVMLLTYPAAALMRRLGRKTVFFCGAVSLFLAGLAGFHAVTQRQFEWLCVAHFLLGAYIACANFYRFAAVDDLDSALKSKALSFVVAGGVLAAFLGPLLATSLKTVVGFSDFALCYASLCALSVATLVLLLAWQPGATTVPALARTDAPPPASSAVPPMPAMPPMAPAVVAIVASAWGYFAMNLMMVQAALVMRGICSFDESSNAIQAHVLAMFAPSFVTGSLIARFGTLRILHAGYAMLALSCLGGWLFLDYGSIFIGLILLGVGWNFTYVGGGALLAQSVPAARAHRWQGINDTTIALCATMGAFTPAPMLDRLGWHLTNQIVFYGTLACLLATLLLRGRQVPRPPA